MTAVSRTRAQIRQELIRRLLPESDYVLQTPSATATGSITYGHLAGQRPDGHFLGGEVWCAVSGTYLTRRISAYAQSTGVITPVTSFGGSAPTDTTVETLRAGLSFDQLNAAIDNAYREAAGYFLVDDDDYDMVPHRKTGYKAPTGWQWLTGVERDHSSIGGDRFCSHATTFALQPLNTLSTNARLAQMFEVTTPATIAAVWIYGKYVGTAASVGNLTASIETTTSSLPSGTNVTNGAGTARAASEADTDLRWFRLALAVPAYIDEATTLAIELKTSVSLDASNYFQWGYDTQSSYVYGARGTYNGATWAAASGAHLFRLETVDPDFRKVDMANVRGVLGAARPIQIQPDRQWLSGTLLRFTGMKTPTVFSVDGDTSEIEPTELVNYALGLLQEQRAAGNLTTLQSANYFKQQAVAAWKRNRTIVKGPARQVRR